MQHLQVGSLLQGGKYRIDAIIGEGGFGNTYKATNTEFQETIALKEFFIRGMTERDETTSNVSVSNVTNTDSFQQQKDKFKKEARRLRQFDNPHIVRVHDMFEENGTAYYVMDFIDGESLSDRMKRTGKPLSDAEVRKFLPQILAALKCMHDAGLWHLDLKPANIMVDKADNAKLIDFGASKQMDSQNGGAQTKTAVAYTSGYAPREQMELNYENLGPWTDIYALGATLYALLTMKKPPVPAEIDDDESADKHVALPFPDCVGNELRALVLRMMNTNRKRRPQNVDVLIAALQGNNDEATMIATTNGDDETKLLNGGQDDETKLAQGTPTDETQLLSTPNNTVKAQPPRPAAFVATPSVSNNQKSGGNKTLLYGIIAALVVAAAVVIGFMFLRNGGADSKDSSEITALADTTVTETTPVRDDNAVRYALISLKEYANELNAGCPISQPEIPGKSVVSVKVKDNAYLVYRIECDVNVMSVREINPNDYKQNIINGLKKDPETRERLKTANVGLLYHYFNSDDETDFVQIVVEAKEL